MCMESTNARPDQLPSRKQLPPKSKVDPATMGSVKWWQSRNGTRLWLVEDGMWRCMEHFSHVHLARTCKQDFDGLAHAITFAFEGHNLNFDFRRDSLTYCWRVLGQGLMRSIPKALNRVAVFVDAF